MYERTPPRFEVLSLSIIDDTKNSVSHTHTHTHTHTYFCLINVPIVMNGPMVKFWYIYIYIYHETTTQWHQPLQFTFYSGRYHSLRQISAQNKKKKEDYDIKDYNSLIVYNYFFKENLVLYRKTIMSRKLDGYCKQKCLDNFSSFLTLYYFIFL